MKVLEDLDEMKTLLELKASEDPAYNSHLKEVEKLNKETENAFHLELETVIRALERKIEDKAQEDMSSMEHIHNRIDSVSAKVASVKAKSTTAASNNAGSHEPPTVQGRSIQSTGRVRDDLTPGRVRAQSAKKTTQRAGQFFAKPGLYTDQTGKEFHTPLKKSGPSKSQTPTNPALVLGPLEGEGAPELVQSDADTTGWAGEPE